jgi:hypothetical protein
MYLCYLQWAEQAADHVMSRGYNRKSLLALDEVKNRFVGLLAR